MGSLWTTRVLCDGIAALGWQPCACWRRAGLMIISHGSVGFCEKKGFLRPGVRYCSHRTTMAGSLSHSLVPILGKPESRE